MSKTTDSLGKLDQTDLVLKHFGLVDQRDQAEMFMAVMNSDEPAHKYELALAVIGCIMQNAGLKTTAVVKALKAAHAQYPHISSVFVFNGETLVIQGGARYCFRLDTLAPTEISAAVSADLLTSMTFHVANVFRQVEAILKE